MFTLCTTLHVINLFVFIMYHLLEKCRCSRGVWDTTSFLFFDFGPVSSSESKQTIPCNSILSGDYDFTIYFILLCVCGPLSGARVV